jgi:hypothetical protein
MDESVIKHLEQDSAQMKMSMALRLGAALRHKCIGEWYSPDGGSCALGAMYEATFMEKKIDGGALIARFPQLDEKIQRPDGIVESLIGAIHHLNDSGWSRESIANWLERRGL